MPKNGNKTKSDEQKVQPKKSGHSKEDGKARDSHGTESNDDLDEVLDLADQIMDREEDAGQDLRVLLDKKSQKVSKDKPDNKYNNIKNRLRSGDLNNNATMTESIEVTPNDNVTKGDRISSKSGVPPSNSNILPREEESAINPDQKDKEDQIVDIPQKILDKIEALGAQQTKGNTGITSSHGKTEGLRKESKAKSKTKTRNKEKLQNVSLQGDGIELNVSVSEEEMDFSDKPAESSDPSSSESESSSGSGSTTELEESDSESDDEPTFRRGRKRQKKPITQEEEE